jgi:cation diffusion facilitator family transporter
MEKHNDNDKRLRFLAEFEGWLSIFINILLFIFKVWVAMISGSVAIMVDAWHSMSDSLSSVILLFGVKMSDKPADDEHPFGHGRSELIAAMIIGVLLAVVAFEFFWQSIERLHLQQAAKYGSWAVWAMIITIVSKEAIAQYAFWAGKVTGMTSLKADAWHHRSDAVSSIIILVGIIFGKQLWWLDGVLGIIVSFIILHAAFNIFRSAISPLLGCAPSREIIEKVTAVCEKYGGKETYVHHFHVHDYGNHTELTFHIHLSANMPLDEAHAVTKKIELELFKEYKITATIHMEPLVADNKSK